MERRDFLKTGLNFFIASGALLASMMLMRFISPAKKNPKEEFYYLMDEDELPKRGVKKAEFAFELSGKKRTQMVFVTNTGNRIVALSPVCTHLGCMVVWDNNSAEFICPCHAGRYNISGDVLSGPPPRPLSKIPLKIDSGKVFVGWIV